MRKSLTKVGVGQLTLTFDETPKGEEMKDEAEETEDNGSAASSSAPAAGCPKERKQEPTPQQKKPTLLQKERKPKWHSLIDKVYALPNLHRAWKKVRANRGAAGVDRMTIRRFAEQDEERIQTLHVDLKNKTYRPQAVRRVNIPKSGGGTRPLAFQQYGTASCSRHCCKYWNRSSRKASAAAATGFEKTGDAARR